MSRIKRRLISFWFLILILEYLVPTITFAAATPSSHHSPKKLNETFNERKIKSGPIFVVDKRTIFVSMFEYLHNNIYNVHKTSSWFKARLKSNEWQELQYGNGDDAELDRDYRRESIYLRVPAGSETDITEFESLCIVNDKECAASVKININADDVIDLPDAPDGNTLIKNNLNKHIFRYPKCCPVGTYKGVQSCIPMNGQVVSRLPVYMADGTYFDDSPLQDVIYEPFSYEPTCDNMYFLDQEDEYYMLLNGRLISSDTNLACIDYMESENDTIVEVIFICAPKALTAEFNALLNKIYVILMFISASVLLLWALVLSILLCRKTIQIKTSKVLSIAYAVFYSLDFIMLATARGMGVDKDLCKIMGYVYQFFLLCSFTALFALIFEGYYRVSHHSRNHTTKRVYWYIGIWALPILTTLASIGTNELSLTQSKGSSCWFRSDRKVYFYYVPIILIIISCIMLQITTYFQIRVENRKKAAFWEIESDKYTNMFRLGAYLNGIMTVCWLMEVLAYCFEAPTPFWFFVDGVNSVQGLAIFVAFSYHYVNVWQKLMTCNRRAKNTGRVKYVPDDLSEEYVALPTTNTQY